MIGTLKNYLRILSDDHRRLNSAVFRRIAGLETKWSFARNSIPGPTLCQQEMVSCPSSKITKSIMSLVIASDRAFELLGSDLEETVKWISSPIEIFFGSSPFEVCMRGEGEQVIQWLNRHLGIADGPAV